MLALVFDAAAGNVAPVPDSIRSLRLYRDVEILSDSIFAGRACGTPGAVSAAQYIADRMRRDGLEVTTRGFVTQGPGGERLVGRNVMACSMRPGARKWIVVTAYYDGLGVRDGRLYPGADSNASGVAALLSLADSLAGGSVLSKSCNVLLVALDGHNAGMSGAEDLWRNFMRGRDVRMAVNLDIIGSSLAPVQPYMPRYVIALGGLPYKKALTTLAQDCGLSIYYDYYRSKDFTELFYRRMGDQKVWLEQGIPSVMFTSGITMNTNKVTDCARTLDYDQMRSRISLIIAWLRTL